MPASSRRRTAGRAHRVGGEDPAGYRARLPVVTVGADPTRVAPTRARAGPP
jgi:hypothetical protein